MEVSPDDLRGSTPVMSAKDLLLELWADMKVVRPIVQRLDREDIVNRLEALEDRNTQEDTARTARAEQRSQVWNFSNKTIAIVILVTNFALGIWVALANGVTP